MKALALHREEPYRENGGHQKVTGTFKAQTQEEGIPMAKYLQCSECGKIAFYYDEFAGTEKPFYLRYMRYPDGTRPQSPRCFSCGEVPRLICDFIKEEKAGAKHE
ncbi:MAG: hypothetical protein ACE5JU_02795 [Candidatus Binatia bacterium]